MTVDAPAPAYRGSRIPSAVLGSRLTLVLLPVVIIGATILSILTEDILPGLAVLAVGGVGLLLRYPRLTVLLMLILGAGPFDITLVTLRVGPLGVELANLLLFLGLAAIMIRRVLGRGPRGSGSSPRFLLVVLGFYAAQAFGFYIGMQSAKSYGAMINYSLTTLALLSYFLIRDVYHGKPRQLAEDLVIYSGVMAGIISIASILHIPMLTGRQIDAVITGSSVSAAVRLDPPLLRMLSVTLMMLAIGNVLRKGPRAWMRWPLLLAMLALEALSLTRSTWLPLIVVAVLLPCVYSSKPGVVTLVQRSVAAIAVGLIAFTLASAGAFGGEGQAAAARLASVQGSTGEDSLELRQVEDNFAWQNIREHPVTGVGWFQPWGMYTVNYTVADNKTTYEYQPFIHQSYLGTWLFMGIPGLLAWATMAVAAIRTGLAAWRAKHLDRATPIACLGGLLVLAVSSSFQTNLSYLPAYIALGVGLAYLDVWLSARAPAVRVIT